jgi:hypothetical protein
MPLDARSRMQQMPMLQQSEHQSPSPCGLDCFEDTEDYYKTKIQCSFCHPTKNPSQKSTRRSSGPGDCRRRSRSQRTVAGTEATLPIGFHRHVRIASLRAVRARTGISGLPSRPRVLGSPAAASPPGRRSRWRMTHRHQKLDSECQPENHMKPLRFGKT